MTLWAWGADNSYGELGSNAYSVDGLYVSPIQIAGSWIAVSGTSLGNTLTSYGAGAGLHPDGSLWTWGANYSGNLGTGIPVMDQTSSPIQIPGTWTKIALGNWSGSLMAIRNNGTLWIVGDNQGGEAGQGNTSTYYYTSPVQIGSASTWNNIIAGNLYWLATQTNGQLWACGINTYGEINSTRNQYTTPVQILTSSSWIQVGSCYSASYDNTSFAIRADNTLWGWGSNQHGQLCAATSTKAYSSPVQITGSWASLSTSPSYSDFMLGIQTNGTLWGWGLGTNGQLGQGHSNKSSPVQVGTATTWTWCGTGNGFSAGLQSNGTLWTWGWNGFGQLGTGNTNPLSSPVQVTGSWTQVAVGFNSVLGIQANGSVWGWGDNTTFALGTGQGGFPNGTPSYYTSPILLAGSWTQLSSSGGGGTTVANGYGLGIQTNGTLWGWGDNSWGELAQTGVTSPANFSPMQIAGSWNQIAAGGYAWTPFVLATKPNGGGLWSWGTNNFGQLGINSLVNMSSPVQVATGSWLQISACSCHWLALRGDYTVWGCGSNNTGEIGQNGAIANFSSPVQVAAGSWIQISAGYDGPLYGTTLLIRSDGTLWALGSNTYGELGNGTTNNYSSPVQIAGSWIQASTGGGANSYGIRSNGSLWAWGYNSGGMLGVGNTTNYSSPVMISSGSWAKVVASPISAYAITTGGVPFAWGTSAWGGWGGGWPDANSGSYSSPVQFPSTWVTLAPLGPIGGFGIRSSSS
jgi:alpha-tubulin suppressor-like RCC1 family protein